MSSHEVQMLFADLALIVIVARVLGRVVARFGQPAVIGEILGGILLGPTVLGGAVDSVFPAGVRPLLTGMADVGVALFMFTVGLEIESRHLRGRSWLTTGSALGSTLVPFGLGIALAFYLLDQHPTDRHGVFIVFVGLSVSVTAFPVLARILTDRGLSRTALGGIALASAAVVDVIAWTGLAGVQAVAADDGNHWKLSLAVPYGLAVVLLVRPLLRRLVGDGTPMRPQHPSAVVVVMCGILLSAAATEAMGLHFIFGAFIFGLVTPKGAAVHAFHGEITDHVGRISGLLLPVYFMVAGLGVDLRHFGVTQAGELGVILLVAMVGKFGGTYLAARLLKLPARPAAALAALMNTRGLTELVILGVGKQLGLLDGPLYSLMVVMAVVTTMMTGPLLTRIYHRPVEVPDPAPRARYRDAEKVPSA
ncbi:cation/H(+) antiporter [Streptomyces sp. PRB2-1]|uniref:Cation/H(+) antiporter n=1 Tax=Actinacidiphila epipremni TaxID=2053013 RepID=A0ABX0ZU38_9ACTN|nr:cation/H(+) antiporter [Actinacidiphila epipremni]